MAAARGHLVLDGRAQRQVIGHVLRTALVKPAMNSAAKTQARTRKTQLRAVSQAPVVLAESLVRSQLAQATLVPTGRLRSSPTLTCCTTVHDRPEVAVLLVCASAPCAPSTTASTQETNTTPARNHSARHDW